MRLHSPKSAPQPAKGIALHKRRQPDGSCIYYAYERKVPPPREPRAYVAAEPPAAIALPPPDAAANARKRASLGKLIWEWQLSDEWKSYAENTRRHYTRHVRLFKPYELWPIALITRLVLIDIRKELVKKLSVPTALAWAATTSSLFRFAEDNHYVDRSPAYRLTRTGGKTGREILKLGTTKPWSEDEYWLAHDNLAEPQRRGIVLLRYTAQRLSDCLKMTWEDCDAAIGEIDVVQEKTKEKLRLTAHPTLLAELKAWRQEPQKPRAQVGCKTGIVVLPPRLPQPSDTILTNAKGKPWTEAAFIAGLARGLYAIEGFPRKASKRRGTRVDGTVTTGGRGREIAARSSHGLRCLAAITLAQAGCALQHIMAVTGHRTFQMAMQYIKERDQRLLAREAIALQVAYERNHPRPPQRRRQTDATVATLGRQS